MVKRMTDITPRNRKSIEISKAPKTKGARFIFAKLLIGTIFVSIILGVVVLHLVFANATILITPKARDLKTDVVITASTKALNVNLESLEIPARVLAKEIEKTQLFDATGSDTVENKAKGTITVYNERTVQQILVTNTRFISENGKLFRTTKRIIIPASSTVDRRLVPGTLNVEVIAAEAGESYNIGAATFSVPGLAGSAFYTLVYGKSTRVMTGGSQGETNVVTKEDIRNAKESLTKTVIRLAEIAILNELPSSFEIAENAFVSEVIDTSTAVSVGAALSQFNYKVKVRVRAIAFQKEYMNEIARGLLGIQINDNELINQNTLIVEYTNDSIGDGTAKLSASISAKAYVNISASEIKKNVLGKKLSEVESMLRNYEGISKFSISLWPFWVQGVPNDNQRAEVRLILD